MSQQYGRSLQVSLKRLLSGHILACGLKQATFRVQRIQIRRTSAMDSLIAESQLLVAKERVSALPDIYLIKRLRPRSTIYNAVGPDFK